MKYVAFEQKYFKLFQSENKNSILAFFQQFCFPINGPKHARIVWKFDVNLTAKYTSMSTANKHVPRAHKVHLIK